jgi:hypothetical protein
VRGAVLVMGSSYERDSEGRGRRTGAVLVMGSSDQRDSEGCCFSDC